MKHLTLLFLALLTTIGVAVGKQNITLEDFVVRNTFAESKPLDVSPMNDGEFYTVLVGGTKIVKHSYKNNKTEEVVFDLAKADSAPFQSFSNYTFSNDEKRILIETNTKRINRHSYSAEYYVWDFYTQTLYPVSENGPQRVASFSPDGERVAFVRDNNIFVKTIRFGTEYAVTTDGKADSIINGVPDWLYEEEFSYTKAYEWSPDSKEIAYVKFDETQVPEYTLEWYKGLAPELTEYGLYPGTEQMKYPKAGEPNPKATVVVHDIKTKTNIEMNTGSDTDVYVPVVRWTPDGNSLGIFVLNRRQNEAAFLYANPNTGDTRTVFTEKNTRYIEDDFFSSFSFLDDNEHFVVISERDGWSHLYLYKNAGFFEKKVTEGNFDVTKFYGYDPQKKVFYYQAARKSPLQREVYAMGLNGKTDKCLSEKEGTNDAIFNKNYQYYLNFYSSIKTPLQVTICQNDGKELQVVEDNKELTEKLADYNLPSREFFDFTTPEGTKLYGAMLKPSGFDPSVKYPVVIYQYCGPNYQVAIDSWDMEMNWQWYLAEQGYIVAYVDTRGTAARGEEFRKCTYMQLGNLESDDQISAAKYLASLPYADPGKIAIWGWSYGGFMVARCLEKGNGVFNTGVAVAPVTNWRFYDSAYTERYMRTPQLNPDGYDDNSPITHAKDLKGNFLLIHGTADDNVHVQNTFEFSEALVQAGVQFDMQVYTNRHHGIWGGNTRMHLFTKITNYFDTHLK